MSLGSSSGRGRFLVFEGLDGSGKSTLIKLLDLELRQKGIRTRLTREPGGTPLAEDIRRILLRTDAEVPAPETELLLYSASRAQHVARVIKPALESGEWVLCDRFSASTVAFQCYARGLSRDHVNWLNHFAEQGSSPDLTFLVDVTVDESSRRQGKRIEGGGEAADRMEREARDFHERVRQGYLAQSEEDAKAGLNRWSKLDGTKSPDELLTLTRSELMMRKWLVS